MARPKKQGLLYFSFDTDFFYSDRRIKALRARFGNDGIVLYIWILCEAYKDKGYYLIHDDDCIDNMMTDLGLTEGFIKQVMEYLASRSLLTQISTLASPVTTITSPGIQKRYQEAMKGQKRTVDVKGEIWLLSKEETASFIKVTQNEAISEKNHSISGKNHSISEKNPLKEKKEKESKVNNIYSAKSANTKKTVKKSECKNKDVVYYQDDELDKTFKDYISFRKEIKAPMTDRGIELAKSKLNKLSENNTSKAIEIINQSIMNSYKGLFEVKASNSEYRQYKQLQSNNRFNNFEQREEKDEDLDGLISKKMNERLKGRRGQSND